MPVDVQTCHECRQVVYILMRRDDGDRWMCGSCLRRTESTTGIRAKSTELSSSPQESGPSGGLSDTQRCMSPHVGGCRPTAARGCSTNRTYLSTVSALVPATAPVMQMVKMGQQI